MAYKDKEPDTITIDDQVESMLLMALSLSKLLGLDERTYKNAVECDPVVPVRPDLVREQLLAMTIDEIEDEQGWCPNWRRQMDQ